MGDEKPMSGCPAPVKKPVSGRASPLISAGQVLDKFISLSNHPSRENSGLKPAKNVGFKDDVRQGSAVHFEFYFVVVGAVLKKGGKLHQTVKN